MATKQDDHQTAVGYSHDEGQVSGERAKPFVSFATAPTGKVAQSYIERNWAKAQAWAASERPDRQFGPVLTDEARRLIKGADHVSDDHR
jgi:hypothetical protein